MKMNNWKEFKIKDIFKTQKRNSILYVPTWAYVPQKELKKWLTPRITVTAENNWVERFSTSTHKNYRKFKNFLSVSFLWSVFYHNYEASLDMKVHCLKPKDKELNKNLWLFLSTIIKKSLNNASYWNQISSSDLPQKTILLPIDRKKQINWKYMEQHIKNIIESKVKKYINFAEKQISTIKCTEIPNLTEKKWKEFKVEKIFNVVNSKPYHKKQLNFSMKEIPYITRTNLNNWIEGLVKKEKFVTNPKNTIVFGAENATFFFEPFEYITWNKMYYIIGKDKKGFNKFIWLFLTTCFNQSVKWCWFWYWKWLTWTREKNRTILLPVNENEQPDWEYMEQYTKNMIIKKYKKFLNYLKEKYSDIEK